ncbi:NUDIX domain-containing protein [Palleronia sediminis]|uniref:NUDIX domain-containing protein n=1 Tax=Palleronia sediminis TaxID=2547833 RepID=A0A4R6A5M5_9RHOB|nr:NUDIX hydrolase [Palleronia sediminis]TDL78155.1 NUDIX domain-containing protein [Palleronia sediminis]
MIRRYGPPPLRDIRYPARPGAYGVVVRGGSILLTFTRSPAPELQLPGGGIDAGEGVLTALHREVYEETGWRIAPRRRLGAFRRFVFMPDYDRWAEKICHVYLAHPVRRLGPPTEPAHEAVWLPLAEAAPRLGNEGDAAMVARVAQQLSRRG